MLFPVVERLTTAIPLYFCSLHIFGLNVLGSIVLSFHFLQTHSRLSICDLTPFSPQEPILPQIKKTVSQGTSIPTNIPPAAAVLPIISQQEPTMADQPAEVNVATGTAANTPNINVIASSANGALKGNPPFVFNGDRHLSKKFLLAFQLCGLHGLQVGGRGCCVQAKCWGWFFWLVQQRRGKRRAERIGIEG